MTSKWPRCGRNDRFEGAGKAGLRKNVRFEGWNVRSEGCGMSGLRAGMSGSGAGMSALRAGMSGFRVLECQV